jgi:hypothetical protein
MCGRIQRGAWAPGTCRHVRFVTDRRRVQAAAEIVSRALGLLAVVEADQRDHWTRLTGAMRATGHNPPALTRRRHRATPDVSRRWPLDAAPAGHLKFDNRPNRRAGARRRRRRSPLGGVLSVLVLSCEDAYVILLVEDWYLVDVS